VSTFWQLVDFEDRLSRWTDLEQPDPAIRWAVVEGIMAAADNVYAGARRHPEIGSNYWRVNVPKSASDEQIVTCCFWVDEETRTVTCDTIATLSLPLD
jgi:hypothetical protein